jgi:hypothetical protein
MSDLTFMPDVMNSIKIDEQHVELLPPRTTMHLFKIVEQLLDALKGVVTSLGKVI